MIGIQIQNRLRQVLCKYTNDFSEFKSVSLAKQIDGKVIANSVNHGLNTGDYIIISGAKRSVDITSIIKTSNQVVITTTQDHDIVDGKIDVINTTNYNGSYNVEVLDWNKIKFNKIGNFANENSGKLLLTDYNGFNGWKQITKIDNDNFSYTPEDVIYGNANGFACIGSRIQHIGSSDRAIKFFENNNLDNSKSWMFVIVGGERVEKEGSAITTSTTGYQGQDYYYRSLLEFSIFVSIPTKSSTYASAEADKARSYIMPILKSIGNYRFDSNLTQQKYQPCIYNGNDTDEYQSAYYVHRFDFIIAGELRVEDTIDELEYTTPLKAINLSINNNLTSNVVY